MTSSQCRHRPQASITTSVRAEVEVWSQLTNRTLDESAIETVRRGGDPHRPLLARTGRDEADEAAASTGGRCSPARVPA